MAKQDIRAGGAFVELSLKRREFLKGLQQASQRLQSMGQSFQNVGKRVALAGAAITAPIAAGIKVFSSFGDQLDKMSQRTGASVSFLSEMGFAAEQSGASIESIEKAMLKMNRRLGRLTSIGGEAGAAMEELGLSVDEIRQMNPEERFFALGKAIKNYGDDAAAAGLAQRAFGIGVDDLLPLFKQGEDGIEKLRQKFRDLTGGITNKDTKAAADFTDALNELKTQVKAAFFQVGAAVAGPLTKFFRMIQPIGKQVIEWVKANKQLVTTIALVGVGLTVAGGALVAFGLAASGLGAALGFIGSVLAVITSPIGFLIAGIGLGTVAFFKFTESGKRLGSTLQKSFGQIAMFARETFGGIVDALKSGDIELAGQIAVTSLRFAFVEGLEKLVSFVGNTFGDAFGNIGRNILAGDFLNAWNATVEAAAFVWASFVEGIASTFGGVANKIINVWQSIQNAITDLIIELISLINKIPGAKKLTGLIGLEGITEANKSEIQSIADEITAGQADVFRQAFDPDAARKRTDAARSSIAKSSNGGSASGLSDAIRKQRDELLARAGRAATKAGAAGGAAGGAGEGGIGSLAGGPSSFGSFSAAAFGFLGGGGMNPAERAAKAAEKEVTLLEAVKVLLERTVGKIDGLVPEVID